MLALTRTRPRPGETPDPGKTPSTIGRYQIRRRLGHGGMSVVYEAFDERLDRSVALKLMLLHDRADDRARLRREAQALAQLSHENVVEVYEIGEHEGKAFITMELVDGHALDRWLRLRRRNTTEVLEKFIGAAEGLLAAHSAGLIHRDFKPGNVLVGHDGRVRVVDFGLVRETTEVSGASASQPDPAEPSDPPAADVPLADDSSSLTMRQTWSRNLTRTGAMVGTPAYMSPEQLSSAPAGPASDQFSFCVALFEALDDHHPFVADDDWSQLPYHVLEGRVLPPRGRRKLPSALLRAIQRGLSVRPEDRWPSMGALLDQLRQALETKRSRTTTVLMGGGVVLVASALAVGPLSQPPGGDRCDEAAATMKQAFDRSRRKQLRRTWLGSRLPGAVDAWERAEPRLDAYVADWWVVHRSACQAELPAVTPATCLQRLALGLQTRVDVIDEPNEAMVHSLVPMLGELPSPDRCTQPQASDEPSVEEDSPWAAELEQIDAYLHMGQMEEAAPLIEALVARAHTEGSPRLLAMVSLRLGSLQHMNNQLDAASRSYEDAYLGAKEYGLGSLSAEAAISLLKLHGESLYREGDAERWMSHAQAEVERLGDPLLEASFLNAAGRALRSKGDLAGALEKHQRALAIQREHLPEGDGRFAWSLFQIGSCLGLMGRGPEGLEVLQESLKISQTVFGPRHPYVAGALNNIGVFLVESGRDEEAIASYQQAIEILEGAYAGSPLYTRFAYVNISAIHARHGRPQMAAATLRTYHQRYQDVVAEEDFDHAHFENITCEVLQYEAKFEQAIPHCERAVELTIEQRGEKHQNAALWTLELAENTSRAGHFDTAMEQAQRAQTLFRKQTVDPVHVAWALEVQLSLHLAQGQLRQARQLAEQRHHIIAKARGEQSPLLARNHVMTAWIAIEQGQPDQARPLLQAARAIAREQFSAEDSRWLGLLAAEAEVDRLTGNLDRARARAEQAVALVEALGYRGTFGAAAQFVLAQLLGSGGKERERSKARRLAQQALVGFSVDGELTRRQRERVSAWLSSSG